MIRNGNFVSGPVAAAGSEFNTQDSLRSYVKKETRVNAEVVTGTVLKSSDRNKVLILIQIVHSSTHGSTFFMLKH